MKKLVYIFCLIAMPLVCFAFDYVLTGGQPPCDLNILTQFKKNIKQVAFCCKISDVAML